MGYRIGVDIGGTFTDSCIIDNEGRMTLAKAPTTYGDLTDGVMQTLELAADFLGLSVEKLLSETTLFSHATTHTTNAMIQYAGVKTGLITTRGFKDHFILMRGARGAGLSESEKIHYSRVTKPDPLVPFDLTEEITERVDYKGRVLVPLDEQGARKAITRLARKGIKALAISFLWSFKMPRHELRVKELASELYPDLFVTAACELAPVEGEYERTTTTVINAYVGPILNAYVRKLEAKLRERGMKCKLLMMQSMGGLISAAEAPRRAVWSLTSGLAGGVLASQIFGRLTAQQNIITSDMGGTSFEVAIISDGHFSIEARPYGPRFGPYISRYSLRAPIVDVTTMGAGGGSVAWLDNNVLKVGPRSAGASPGPACYGQGGKEATVTDADIVLGYLDPDYFLGGRMKVYPELARSALRERVADSLGLSVEQAAAGVAEVINSQMADLVRKGTIERGHDPREFVLLAYGGAGPTHAAFYAEDLGVKGIVVPGRGLATAQSAFGVAVADLKTSRAMTELLPMPLNPDHVTDIFERLEQLALEDLLSWGAEREKIFLRRYMGMRYRRQVSELDIQLPDGKLTRNQLDEAAAEFERRYESLFGKDAAYREAGIEAFIFRLDGTGLTGGQVELVKFPKNGSAPPSDSRKPERKAYFPHDGGFVATSVFDGDKLRAGNVIHGPAIVEFPGTTCVIPPQWRADLDEYENVILTK